MSDLTTVVDWSRLQFAITAIYHWLFVPLTLGLSVIVAIMESIYLKTKSEKWLLATKFWMRLFGINFAIGVATGIILEFEFGTNWSNYSWFVGDIIRRAACHRRNTCILHGVYFRGGHVFRMEQSKSAFPSRLDLAHRTRSLHLGTLDSRCQRMDAISCWHGV